MYTHNIDNLETKSTCNYKLLGLLDYLGFVSPHSHLLLVLVSAKLNSGAYQQKAHKRQEFNT